MRPRVAGRVSSHINPILPRSDVYMRKAYTRVVWKRPNALFLLGDLLDGGRTWDDDECVPRSLWWRVCVCGGVAQCVSFFFLGGGG